MMPARYACATDDLNTHLSKLGNPDFVPKNPQVVIKMLADIEAIVTDHIVTRDFTCESLISLPAKQPMTMYL